MLSLHPFSDFFGKLRIMTDNGGLSANRPDTTQAPPAETPAATKRVITTSRDTYGLDTATLRERLVTITGSEAGANDALAAVAEWLDTAKYTAPDFTKQTRVHKLPKKTIAKGRKIRPNLRRRIRHRVASAAAHFAETLATELEGHVTDSEYVLVEGKNHQTVRRRILHEIE